MHYLSRKDVNFPTDFFTGTNFAEKVSFGFCGVTGGWLWEKIIFVDVFSEKFPVTYLFVRIFALVNNRQIYKNSIKKIDKII